MRTLTRLQIRGIHNQMEVDFDEQSTTLKTRSSTRQIQLREDIKTRTHRQMIPTRDSLVTSINEQ